MSTAENKENGARPCPSGTADIPGAQRDLDYDVLPQLVGYHLRRAQVTMFSGIARSMSEKQITPGQFGVLTIVNANPGLTQSALAKAVGIERSTMVATIDSLQAAGLVERNPSPADRRSYALDLSPQGRALIEELKGTVMGQEDDLLQTLSADEKAQLISLLRRIWCSSQK